MSKTKKHSKALLICIIIALIVAVAITILIGYDYFKFHSRPDAVLHANADVGYIVSDKTNLDIDIDAYQAFVYDAKTERIIYLKGEEKIVYPASTTKLITILTALEYLSPEEIVTPTDELTLVEDGSSIAYIRSNHRVSVEMLIEGMLIPSGNDAAYVLAAAAGRKIKNDASLSGKDAVVVFVEEMNAYGKKIGLCGSHFTAPDGYYNDDHYTTLEDMIIISKLAVDNELITRYACLASDDVTYASGETNTWINTNEMLDKDSKYYNKYVTGLKTGSSDNNYCLVSTVTDGNDSYIVGVFASKTKEGRFEDTQKIIDKLFK